MTEPINIVAHVDFEKRSVTKAPKKLVPYMVDAGKRAKVSANGFYLFSVIINGAEVTAQLEGAVNDVTVFIKPEKFEIVTELIRAFGKTIIDEVQFKADLESLDDSIENIHFNATTFLGADSLSDKKFLENILEITQAGHGSSANIASGESINAALEDISTEFGFVSVGAGVPDIIGDGYILSEELRLLWNWITAPISGKTVLPVVCLLEGIQGSGKTDFANQLVKHFRNEGVEVDFAFMAMSQIERPKELFYRRGVRDGNTVDEPNEMTMHLLEETERPLIVLLDEINRISSTEIQNPLLQLLGEQKKVEFGDRMISYNRPVLFLCTANVGDDFVGTDLFDIALWNRFHFIVKMKSPSEKQFVRIAMSHFKGELPDNEIEKVASVIYQMTNHLLENNMPIHISARDMLHTLTGMRVGDMTIRTAMTFSVLRKLVDDDVRSAIEAIFNAEVPL